MHYNFICIDTPDDPRIAHFAKVRDGEFKERGEIIVDSALVVERALNSGFIITEMLATQQFFDKFSSLIAKLPNHDSIVKFVAANATLEQVIGYRLHQGVMIIAKRPPDTPLTSLGAHILVLNGINNAENVGAVVRNCDAFGVGALIVDRQSCSPWVRRSIRVSMGSVFAMQCYHSMHLSHDLLQLKRQGYQLIAMANHPSAQRLDEVLFAPKTAIILGGEYTGIDAEILALSNIVVRIPLTATIDSLNVAVASGITLYQMSRTSC